MWSRLPLLVFPVLGYNVLALTWEDGVHTQYAQSQLVRQASLTPLPSGASFSVDTADLILSFSVVLLFIEMFRHTGLVKTDPAAQAISLALLGICALEFAFLPAFATSTFFLITVMVLLGWLSQGATS